MFAIRRINWKTHKFFRFVSDIYDLAVALW
jgi:hypothetical protein